MGQEGLGQQLHFHGTRASILSFPCLGGLSQRASIPNAAQPCSWFQCTRAPCREENTKQGEPHRASFQQGKTAFHTKNSNRKEEKLKATLLPPILTAFFLSFAAISVIFFPSGTPTPLCVGHIKIKWVQPMLRSRVLPKVCWSGREKQVRTNIRVPWAGIYHVGSGSQCIPSHSFSPHSSQCHIHQLHI